MLCWFSVGAITNHHKLGAIKLHTFIISHFWMSKFQQRSFGLNQSVDSETSETLCCNALGHTSPHQQGTKKLYGTKNNCTSGKQGQILDKWYKETKKPKCHFWRAGSKSRVLRMPAAHTTTKGVGKPPKPSLQANPSTLTYPHPRGS